MEAPVTDNPRITSEERTQGNLEYFKRRGSPIAAPATAPGGPICIIRVSGKDLSSVLVPVLGTLPEAGTFSLKEIFQLSGERTSVIDRSLVLFFKTPHSFTGEDVVEIHAHGIPSIVEAICESLRDAGVRTALPGEFTFRAVMNGKMSLEKAEQLHLALSSEGLSTEVSAKLIGASKESGDSVDSLLKEAIRKVQVARGRVEAAIDFPEAESEQSADLESALYYIEEIKLGLSRLLTAFENFCLQSSEQRVALIGRTNVGKSTLFNLLVGGKRAIVSKIAGTTRDALEAQVRLPSGRRVRLIDTAGLRELDRNSLSEHESLEAEGMKMSLEAAKSARLVLHVRKLCERTDSSSFSHEFSAASVLELYSHADESSDRPEGAFDFLREREKLSTWLLAQLDSKLSDFTGSSSDQIILSDRQGKLIRTALEECMFARVGVVGQAPLEIAALHLKETEALLKKAIGEEVGQEYIGQIFSQFCLGK